MLFTWNDFCAIVTLGVGESRSNAPRHMAIPTSFILLFLSSADDSTRRRDPGLLEQASMRQMRAVAPGFLLSQGKVSNALPQQSTSQSRSSRAQVTCLTHGPAPWGLANTPFVV